MTEKIMSLCVILLMADYVGFEMKRRDFLKLIGVATVAPSVLAGKAAPVGLTLNMMQREILERLCPEHTGEMLMPIGLLWKIYQKNA